jgi:hypothetical protein
MHVLLLPQTASSALTGDEFGWGAVERGEDEVLPHNKNPWPHRVAVQTEVG